MAEYIDKDLASSEKCCNDANERLFAFLYLENFDQVKYGFIMQSLAEKKPLVMTPYPEKNSRINLFIE